MLLSFYAELSMLDFMFSDELGGIFIKIYESGGSVFVPGKNGTQTAWAATEEEAEAVDRIISMIRLL